jgi:hypothetical protein
MIEEGRIGTALQVKSTAKSSLREVDDDRLAAVTNFVADRRFDVQFPTGREPKGNFVANSTRNPTVLGDPRHGGASHPGCATDDLQNGRDGVDPGNRRYVGSHAVSSLETATGLAGFPLEASATAAAAIGPSLSILAARIRLWVSLFVHAGVPAKAGARFVSQSLTARRTLPAIRRCRTFPKATEGAKPGDEAMVPRAPAPLPTQLLCLLCRETLGTVARRKLASPSPAIQNDFRPRALVSLWHLAS